MFKISSIFMSISFAFLLLAPSAWAQSGYGMGQGGMGQGMGQGMQQQRMLQMLGPVDANYDLRLMNMMIKHQQMTLSMANNALANVQHPELKQMIQNMINNQTEEIQQMQALRDKWYNQ